MSNSNPTYLDGLFQPITVQNSGTDLPKEPKLNFIGMTVADDPANERVNVTGSVSKLPFGPSGNLVTPPDVSAFSLVNPAPNWVGSEASTAVIQNHPSGYGVAIYGTGTSAHETFNGAFQARGSKTSLIVQLDAPYWDGDPNASGSISPPFGGIFLYSPATNKSIIWGPYAGNGSGTTYLNGIYLFHQNIAGAATTQVYALGPGRSTFPIWLRWFDDGVNYNFAYSFDGDFTYAPTVSESRTAFLSDGGTQIGVACCALQNAGTRAGRRSASIWLGSWSLT